MQRMRTLGLAMAVFASAPASALTAHEQEIAAWRAGRVERLTAPGGWLAVVGLNWLEKDKTVSVGSADDAQVKLDVGPAHLGELSWQAGAATLKIAPEVDATVEGEAVTTVTLVPDSAGAPTIVQFGSVNLHLIERGQRFAFRVKDAEALTRKSFVRIDSFEVDSSWRVDARYEQYPEPRTIEVATVVGTLEAYPNPGKIVFDRGGKTYSLEALVEEGTEQFFLIMADRTSGKETYGMARYLYAGPPVDGKIVVDFNKAYNPPCAFTAYATCPMPPEGNRLDLFVRAGERKYLAGH